MSLIVENDRFVFVCGGYSVNFYYSFVDCFLFDLFVVVGGDYIWELEKVEVIVWLKNIVINIKCVVSVCIGVFLFVKMGFLSGKNVMIYW